ncbi:hypothetical protein GCM10023196_100280 [Actinoallomurus vinaceus]|uniref:Uncharacterized protein n=1 Tax=Actinoallomurus vinaceus TaxID=1080074 RepID=A0ABP8UV22_9ACTN
MADDIVVQDSDDRSERMIRDPKRYFEEARQRAERELKREVEGRPHRNGRVEHG